MRHSPAMNEFPFRIRWRTTRTPALRASGGHFRLHRMVEFSRNSAGWKGHTEISKHRGHWAIETQLRHSSPFGSGECPKCVFRMHETIKILFSIEISQLVARKIVSSHKFIAIFTLYFHYLAPSWQFKADKWLNKRVHDQCKKCRMQSHVA